MKLTKRKKPIRSWIIPVLILMISLGIYDFFVKDIKVSINSEVTAFKVTNNTVRELLYEKNIDLSEDDYINVDLEHGLTDGMEIIIRRSIPITIYNGNERIDTMTTEATVQGVIESLDIQIEDDDEIIPDPDTKISKDMEIKIVKIDNIIESIAERIPYDVIERENRNIFSGNTLEIQPGQEGIVKYKIKKTYKNGRLIDEEIIDSYLVQYPVDAIIEKGSKDYLVSSRGKVGYKKSLTMVATAYDLSYVSTGKKPGDENYGITASGTKVRPGVVAVDPNVIPLGTKLYIESLDGWPDYGFAVAEDTGGAIKGNKIDLYMEDRTKALQFGRRKVKVYILE